MNAAEGQDARQYVLSGLVRSSLAQGHYKVAYQRLLMMRACGLDIPEEILSECERNTHRLRPAEWRRMKEAASDFAAILRRRY
jgi:hypothetical protein